jgi:hypothetical protein
MRNLSVAGEKKNSDHCPVGKAESGIVATAKKQKVKSAAIAETTKLSGHKCPTVRSSITI